MGESTAAAAQHGSEGEETDVAQAEAGTEGTEVPQGKKPAAKPGDTPVAKPDTKWQE